jgi:hypothetical protein
MIPSSSWGVNHSFRLRDYTIGEPQQQSMLRKKASCSQSVATGIGRKADRIDPSIIGGIDSGGFGGAALMAIIGAIKKGDGPIERQIARGLTEDSEALGAWSLPCFRELVNGDETVQSV